MIVLAVLLLLVVALVVLFVVVTGTAPTVSLEWAQINTTVTLTALAVFLLGAACLLVAQLGLSLLLRGNRKNAERRKELKHLRRVEAERARHSGAPATSGTDRPAGTARPDAGRTDQADGGAAAPAEPTRSDASGGRAGSSRS